MRVFLTEPELLKRWSGGEGEDREEIADHFDRKVMGVTEKQDRIHTDREASELV